MFFTFFDIKGIVHFEFIPQDQLIKLIMYVEIMKRLHEAIRRERPEICPSGWIPNHDNAPAHKALSVKQLRKQKIEY
jgi:hypothetical protein